MHHAAVAQPEEQPPFKRTRAGSTPAGGIRARRRSFPGSSTVEHAAVNRAVAGASPARGARRSEVLLHPAMAAGCNPARAEFDSREGLHVTGCSSAWKSTRLGTGRSSVRIGPPRPRITPLRMSGSEARLEQVRSSSGSRRRTSVTSTNHRARSIQGPGDVLHNILDPASFLGRSSRTAERPADNRKAGGATPSAPILRRKCYGSTRGCQPRSAGSTPARRTIPHGIPGVVACTPDCASGGSGSIPEGYPKQRLLMRLASQLPCRGSEGGFDSPRGRHARAGSSAGRAPR